MGSDNLTTLGGRILTDRLDERDIRQLPRGTKLLLRECWGQFVTVVLDSCSPTSFRVRFSGGDLRELMFAACFYSYLVELAPDEAVSSFRWQEFGF